MLNNNLLLLILIPLAISFLNIFLPTIIRKILVFATLVVTSVITVNLFNANNETFTLFSSTILSLDKMSYFALAGIQLLSFIILIFSLKGVENNIEKQFFALYPLTLAFSNGVVLSENSFSFLIFWGMSGLTLYLFSLLGKTKDSPQTAKKTFLIIGGSDAFLIMGLALVWFLNSENSWLLLSTNIPLVDGLSYTAFFLFLIAAFSKAGGFPFHTWVPDYSKDSPVESVALLPASLDKLLGIYLLARIVTTIFEISVIINLIIVTLGAITVIIAVMMAMIQHNGRKLLGYHAVSQVGYMIMGIGSGSVLAFAGGLFHMINHTIYKSNLFLTLGSVEKRTGTSNLNKLGGLGKVMPFTFIMALIGALSISGIPPFNGFFSKWMIYQGIIEKTATLSAGYQIWMIICLVLAIFGSALTLASFMKFIHAIYLGKYQKRFSTIKKAPVNQILSTGLLSLLCIIFGIWAVKIPLNNFILPALQDSGLSSPQFIGTYNPQLMIILFGLAFITGIIIFLFTKKIKLDENYLGGMDSEERFRVLGTEFYNEVKEMTPLNTLYKWAEKKYFDIYNISTKFTISTAKLLQKAHPGQLQLYLLYIVVGLLIFFIVNLK